MTQKNQESLNYKSAGVDIEAGDALVERIKPIAAKTRNAGVMAGLGGFGSLFELPLDRYKNPVLVSGTDGVGTKLKLAFELDKHDTVGIDLVAMCVNDIVVQGAEPLFFLDYFATGKLDVNVAAQVIAGIGKGCEEAGAALVGGETAEMPGMYADGEYDLAGFCVGVVEKDKIIDGRKVQVGDCLIGLPASGAHSNGYSLIRKVIETTQADIHDYSNENKEGDYFPGSSLPEVLMEPTKIYVKPLLGLIKRVDVHALAHITGGGITENLPRVLPEGINALIDTSFLTEDTQLWQWLQTEGNISQEDMLKTFNCGIGMIICVAPEDVEETLSFLKTDGAQEIGRCIAGDGKAKVIYQD